MLTGSSHASVGHDPCKCEENAYKNALRRREFLFCRTVSRKVGNVLQHVAGWWQGELGVTVVGEFPLTGQSSIRKMIRFVKRS